MEHNHTCGHGHTHGKDEADYKDSGRKLALSISITGLTLIAELVGGLLTGSLALLSDAAHVFLDIFALALSYGAVRIASRSPSVRHSYGFSRMKVIAAFINGATLLLMAIEIFREAVVRFLHPQPVLAAPMLVVASIGLVANLLVAFVLGGHDHEDLNARSAFLHVIGDALSSVGVIIAGILMILTGLTWIDAFAGVLIGAILLSGSWRVLREAIHILNEGAPDGVDTDKVADAIKAIPEVVSVHDTHVWAIEPGYSIMSTHVVLPDRMIAETGKILSEIKEMLAHRFSIEHTTIQFECDDCGQCSGNHNEKLSLD